MKENDAASFEVPIFTTIANIVAKKILHLRKRSNFDSYWELPSSTSRYIIRPSNDNVENIPKKIEKKKKYTYVVVVYFMLHEEAASRSRGGSFVSFRKQINSLALGVAYLPN